MNVELELSTFRQAAAILRFSWPEEATTKQLGRLFKIFHKYAVLYAQNGSADDFSTFRMSVVTALLNRPITTFSAITKGEAMLITKEPNLDALVAYVWERQHSG